jgi:hypothetical protein
MMHGEFFMTIAMIIKKHFKLSLSQDIKTEISDMEK